MKIAILNEFSQTSKNEIVVNELKKVVEPMEHQVYNAAIGKPPTDRDTPEAYTLENPCLAYLHLGIRAALPLNSGAVDFVVTGYGTGQGTLMSLNMHSGVVCGYCIEPTDAYLLLQISSGSALSIPYAKGFGQDAELNLNNIFTKAFGPLKGMGYPDGRREAQNRSANLLFEVRKQVAKPLLETLKSIDPQLVKECMIPRFSECFYEGYKDEEVRAFVDEMVEL